MFHKNILLGFVVKYHKMNGAWDRWMVLLRPMRCGPYPESLKIYIELEYEMLYTGKLMHKLDRSLPSRSLQTSDGEREVHAVPLRMFVVELERKPQTSAFHIES